MWRYNKMYEQMFKCLWSQLYDAIKYHDAYFHYYTDKHLTER